MRRPLVCSVAGPDDKLPPLDFRVEAKPGRLGRPSHAAGIVCEARIDDTGPEG